MAIYIKGMRMPENGLYQIVDGIIRVYDYRNLINDNEKDIQSYNIIEVPEPHGRLIDANKALDELFDDKRRDVGLMFSIYGAPTIIERNESLER